MKNLMNNNKGITLLALIITIIVMLILAGVTLSMTLGEDGIIAQAEKAGEEQRGATVEEHRDLWKSSINTDSLTNISKSQTLDEVVSDLKEGKLINQEEAESILNKGYVVIGSRKIEFIGIPPGLQIGSFVEYKPEGTYTWQVKYSNSTYNNKTNIELTSKEGEKAHVKEWRVFEIDTKTEMVKLIPNKIHNTATTVLLGGAQGYNNGIFLLNEACENLYGNKKNNIKARCINIEDIIDKIKDDVIQEVYKEDNSDDAFGIFTKYGDTRNMNEILFPITYEKELKGELNRSEQKELIENDDKGNLSGMKKIAGVTAKHTSFDTENIQEDYFKQQIYMNLLKKNHIYWVASRHIVLGSDSSIEVGLFAVTGMGDIVDRRLQRSSSYQNDCMEYPHSGLLLPVVEVKGDLISIDEEGNFFVDIDY